MFSTGQQWQSTVKSDITVLIGGPSVFRKRLCYMTVHSKYKITTFVTKHCSVFTVINSLGMLKYLENILVILAKYSFYLGRSQTHIDPLSLG